MEKKIFEDKNYRIKNINEKFEKEQEEFFKNFDFPYQAEKKFIYLFVSQGNFFKKKNSKK